MLSLLAAFAVALAPEPAPALTPTPIPAPSEPNPYHQAVLETELGQFWGAVLVADGAEPLLLRGYGLLRPDRPEPIDEHALFDIGSVSKPLLAIAVLRLAEQGVLSLETTLADLFEDVPEDKAGITIEHLLRHRSGLVPALNLTYQEAASREAMLAKLFASTLQSAPGTAHAYSNVGFTLLAACLEEATGKPFEQVMREQVFDPAGMNSTAVLGDDSIRSDGSPRLDPDHATARIAQHGGEAHATDALDYPSGWGHKGATGVITTAADLMALVRALAGDALLPADAKERLFTPDENHQALAWTVLDGPRGRLVYHTGSTGGYTAILYYLPDRDAAVAVLSNTRPGAQAILGPIFELFTAEAEAEAEVSAELRIERLELNRYGAAKVPGIVFVPEPLPEGGLRLRVERGGETIATSDLSRGAARDLLRQVAAVVRESETLTGEGSDAIISTVAYDTGHNGRLRLDGRELHWLAMSAYRASHPDGTTIIDPRLTLVLQDTNRGFWPLIVRLDREAAAAFHEAFRAATEGAD